MQSDLSAYFRARLHACLYGNRNRKAYVHRRKKVEHEVISTRPMGRAEPRPPLCEWPGQLQNDYALPIRYKYLIFGVAPYNSYILGLANLISGFWSPPAPSGTLPCGRILVP